MEHYSDVKNKDIMKFAIKWLELEKNILSEGSQRQKGKQGVYSLIGIYYL